MIIINDDDNDDADDVHADADDAMNILMTTNECVYSAKWKERWYGMEYGRRVSVQWYK